MTQSNNGSMMEEKMRKWFKGKFHPDDSVDFQSKTTLYEIKSCNIINNCKHKGKSPISDHQLGRFQIKRVNHEKIRELGEAEGKRVVYVFVIGIENQAVWKTKTWNEIDELVHKDRKWTRPRIRDIFKVVE